jgi:hypothetical protein
MHAFVAPNAVHVFKHHVLPCVPFPLGIIALSLLASPRRISPRANFCAFMGERYGTQFLPASLDKNEYMAVCGSLMEDDEDDMALLALFQKWFLAAILFASALLIATYAFVARSCCRCRLPNESTMSQVQAGR